MDTSIWSWPSFMLILTSPATSPANPYSGWATSPVILPLPLHICLLPWYFQIVHISIVLHLFFLDVLQPLSLPLITTSASSGENALIHLRKNQWKQRFGGWTYVLFVERNIQLCTLIMSFKCCVLEQWFKKCILLNHEGCIWPKIFYNRLNLQFLTEWCHTEKYC